MPCTHNKIKPNNKKMMVPTQMKMMMVKCNGQKMLLQKS